MTYLKTIFSFGMILALFSGPVKLDTNNSAGEDRLVFTTDACWPETDHARTIMESFLSHPNWESERSETGTSTLNVSQIQLLTDSQFSQTCELFNTRYSETISKKSGQNNDRKYDFVYYKAGDFYFAIIVLAPPSDPDEVAIGLSFISIFDNNLNRLAGYTF